MTSAEPLSSAKAARSDIHSLADIGSSGRIRIGGRVSASECTNPQASTSGTGPGPVVKALGWAPIPLACAAARPNHGLMNTQNISVTGRPGETAQQQSDGSGALFLKILGVIVGLGLLAYVAFWIVIGSAFANFQY